MENITKEAYFQVVAERDEARQSAFNLKTQLEAALMELARARRDASHYRRHWNNATNELKRMMDRACKRKKVRRA